MPRYAISFVRSARKELEHLPNPAVERIIDAIEKLSSDPYPFGSKKLKGERSLWRIRVGDYRIMYSVGNSILTIEIIRIRHRKEAYN